MTTTLGYLQPGFDQVNSFNNEKNLKLRILIKQINMMKEIIKG